MPVFEPGSDEDLIVRTVREFVARDVLPVAAEMERGWACRASWPRIWCSATS
jgi:hypothetical protein